MSKAKPKNANRPGRQPAAPQMDGAPTASVPMPLRWRWLVSGLILLHFLAILAATNVASRPFSPLWEALADFFRPYVNATDLNHGYRFFAPNPGPSHLVEYELTMPDGKVEKGRFPDRRQEWPRLLYHRYFMLAEHLDGFFGEWQDTVARQSIPTLEPAAKLSLAAEAESERQLYQSVAESFGRALMHRAGAVRVKLTLLEHGIPSADMFAQGHTALDDHSFYMPLGEPLIFTDAPQPEELR